MSAPAGRPRCQSFQPHHLRPDKCRNCFGDIKQHTIANGGNDESESKMDKLEAVGQSTSNKTNDQQQQQKEDSNHASEKQQTCNKCQMHQNELDRLKLELEQWQARCQVAEQANVKVREEMRLLENEMEEMHDNFKEEESEQFEQVKQELDAALKNCKILQIRLNKSERQYSQLEQVKTMLEQQLNESQQRQQPQEEGENSTQLDSTNLGPNKSAGGNQVRLFELDGGDFVRVPTNEYDQLLRDLNDTSERERDLQEQIKFSQEEAQLKGERLQAIEAENEILLGRINKLTVANSNLRSSLMASSSNGQLDITDSSNRTGGPDEKVRELCEQNEQLKLALEVLQAECQRVKEKSSELQQILEMKERTLKELEVKLSRHDELERLRTDNCKSLDTHDQMNSNQQLQTTTTTTAPLKMGQRLELECRQLRARLAHSERECRQLRSQLEMVHTTRSFKPKSVESPQARRPPVSTSRSQSMELPGDGANSASNCQSSKCRESLAQLDQQCRSLVERNQRLETKLQRFIEFSNQDLDQKTNMESDLFSKLKQQLESSESELAKAKSRLVELDIECGRAQRQHKRLLSSLESCGSLGGELASLRRNRLPQDEATRDAMSRQELRQAMRELELDIDQLVAMVKAKECLIKELEQQQQQSSSGANTNSSRLPTDRENELGGANLQQQQQQRQPNQLEVQASEQQVRSLRRLLDQEQLLSNNLKLDVANLERDNAEMATRKQLLERERVAMEEELDKWRQLSGEFRAELEESQREKQMALNKSRELTETIERLRLELNQSREQQQQQQKQQQSGSSGENGNSSPQTTDMLLMARDLSELKVKNGFLMRQLEIAREDTARQLDELRGSNEAQLRRAVEMAQIELKERHLQETQQLRDDLNESKQKVVNLQRQTTRQEEEVSLERDRARAIERDWRRDKSQWQQAREQLEGQLTIERRSSEFRLKEAEAAIRDKERQLINVQDRCVQLERDLKRLQNKFHLLEEDSESRLKQLTRDLEIKTKELNELSGQRRSREEQQFEMLKRLQDEKSTLKDTLESMRSSYDEKLVESRQLKELLHSRQEQAYKERAQHFERIETMTRRLNELSEQESQVKLLKQRLEMQERQLESHRRDLVQLREERIRLKARCDELEKRELITKTSSISGATNSSFFKPFGSPRAHLLGSARQEQVAPSAASSTSCRGSTSPTAVTSPAQNQSASCANANQKAINANKSSASDSVISNEQQSMIERLSGKINDQRNLINILRQQLNESQMELKQLKLLQSSEKSKWQARLALLNGRLNECEEKLAYETAMLNKNPVLLDQLARPRLELAWCQERKLNLDLIQQQQSQLELLAKDLKKTSQAHDLLRLQSKQLESHNNKLSKKLIEYQQQTNIFNLQDRELELSHDRLLRKNTHLSHEVRPMLEIVSKIVASLDAPEQMQQQQQQQLQLQAKLDSTDRPLRAGLLASRAERALDSDDDSQLELEIGSTARPAHLIAATPSPSRLTRLLAGGAAKSSSAVDTAATTSQRNAQLAPKKTVKRVRVKCSTLGITTNEKKQLKQHLKALNEALSPPSTELADNKIRRPDSKQIGTIGHHNQRASAESHEHSSSQPATATGGSASRGKSQSRANETDQSSQQSSSHTSRVHWQMDSDLESECSWSAAAEPTTRQDLYRRFPQASPSSGTRRGHSAGPTTGGVGGVGGGITSLTDYESESSLASDYSLSTFAPPSSLLAGRRPGAPSGAESDSGLTAGAYSNSSGSGKTLGRKLKSSSGLKGRLTNTLRTISRSITGGLSGGLSDTEETLSSYEQRQRRSRGDETEPTARANLKEIRV